ncbi:MAG TPA: DUF4252 domain-containing protein [Steroidobacteraceae bacterium]|nr:DUF4252 domain-containing protein [Steroidobacteraceae bacterium]
MNRRIGILAGAWVVSTLALAGAKAGAAESGRLALPDFHALESQASESTVVTLGPWMLHFASHFCDRNDPDGAATRRMLASIRSITIHSYEFDRDFAYSKADVDAVRAQLRAPNWNRLAQVRSKDRDDVDVYVSTENDRTTGLAVISSEPRELTIINIVGSISADDLQRLGMHLDVPGLRATRGDAQQDPPAT